MEKTLERNFLENPSVEYRTFKGLDVKDIVGCVYDDPEARIMPPSNRRSINKTTLLQYCNSVFVHDLTPGGGFKHRLPTVHAHPDPFRLNLWLNHGFIIHVYMG